MDKEELQAEMAASLMDAAIEAALWIGGGVAAGAVLFAIGLGILKGISTFQQMRRYG